MESTSPSDPNPAAAEGAHPKKVWTPPRLTVYGTLPTLTLASSVTTKTAP